MITKEVPGERINKLHHNKFIQPLGYESTQGFLFLCCVKTTSRV
jgi:hypothetical protein